MRTVATLCPKCGGQKHVAKPPYVPGDVHQWPANDTRSYPCPLCNGAGYIETLGDVHYTGSERDK